MRRKYWTVRVPEVQSGIRKSTCKQPPLDKRKKTQNRRISYLYSSSLARRSRRGTVGCGTRGASGAPGTLRLCKRDETFRPPGWMRLGVLGPAQNPVTPEVKGWTDPGAKTFPRHLSRPGRRSRGNDAPSRESYHLPGSLRPGRRLSPLPPAGLEKGLRAGKWAQPRLYPRVVNSNYTMRCPGSQIDALICQFLSWGWRGCSRGRQVRF